MVKKSARNSELLKEVKSKTSPQIYGLLLDLINEGREDLAELVLKVDYLIDYTNTCIKQNDYGEAEECLQKVTTRIHSLKEQGINTETLDYLCEGLVKKLESKN